MTNHSLWIPSPHLLIYYNTDQSILLWTVNALECYDAISPPPPLYGSSPFFFLFSWLGRSIKGVTDMVMLVNSFVVFIAGFLQHFWVQPVLFYPSVKTTTIQGSTHGQVTFTAAPGLQTDWDINCLLNIPI